MKMEGKQHGWKLNTKAAELIYAGIVGDTGRFLFPNTTKKTLKYAGELIEFQPCCFPSRYSS
jgi:phosphoesterase RecJ-like protein